MEVQGELTDWFDLEVGVRQGCPLSPVLFNVFVNGLLRAIKATGLGVRVDSGNLLAVLAYAGDLVLLADSNADLQAMMDAVHGFCTKWRIELNVKKTEVVVFGRRGNHHSNIVYGSRKEVAEYMYTGLLLKVRYDSS